METKRFANLIACFQLVYPPPMDLLGSSTGSKYRSNLFFFFFLCVCVCLISKKFCLLGPLDLVS